MLEFAVQAIKSREGCQNPYSTEPPGMRPVTVDVVVNTKADPDGTLQMITFGHGWEYIAPDGTSIDATGSAVPCEYDSPQLKPNRKYTATIWMWVPADAPTDGSGLLVWNPSFADLGYEWKFATA
jgi:hypothetical protein